eukprot:TRINITY_DN18618_c0_g1_i1.p1 TRINITY_DN18618_c0_g1~~TRINITY_DN18618_c0_g1_i1.p1  ORF type:complete len:275 (+),score=130.06 TRINITY_DN18618_c0_g1_i1:55-825(+)
MAASEGLTKIGEAVRKVYRRIDAACAKCGRDPSTVTLCYATKTRTMEEVLEAAKHSRSSPCVVGENYVQAAVERVEEGIRDHPFDKHFIGHLQSNKINQVLQYADCIQTVDTEKLAGKLFNKVKELDRTLRIYCQVNTSGEEQKSGCSPEEAVALCKTISERYGDRLVVEGLMTIGINSEDQDRVEACFKVLAALRDQINALDLPNAEITQLSMGMTQDLELAIEHGSTQVRVGTAIFGERHYPQKPAQDAVPSNA